MLLESNLAYPKQSGLFQVWGSDSRLVPYVCLFLTVHHWGNVSLALSFNVMTHELRIIKAPTSSVVGRI